MEINEKQGYGDKKYSVGVDIGGTKILVCIADIQGKIVYKRKTPTTSKFDEIFEIIQNCINNSSITLEQVISLGFGIPGITDSKSGIIVEAPAFNWKYVPFGEKMQSYFKQPIFVNNDVNCAAFGERWIGGAKGIEDFVFIAIGTGVGSAIFANGNIINGYKSMAGEIGYLITEDDIQDNKMNSFGDFGTFEKKASGNALSQSGIDPKSLFLKYSSGDKDAIMTINRFIMSLSIGIANIASILNPEKVIIGGGVSSSLPFIMDSIQNTISQLTPVKTKVEISTLGEESGAIGASRYAVEQFYASKGEKIW